MAAAALLLWLAVSLPLALGERTLFFRDVFSTHLPLKAFGAAELHQGRVPAFNPTWGLGQPFRGNPNTLAFYPGNLFYLALPFWSAFNLHYALHWLLAAVAMGVLARTLGLGRRAALLAALTYAGSGWVLTGLSFYNLLAASAWWPLAMAGAARGGRRGIALGGAACGMALLAGAPVTAALGVLPLAWVAVERHGWRRGLVTAAAVGALGLVVALPQVVATLRVLPWTVRGRGLVAELNVPGLYALQPGRLLELLLPLPFGRPGSFGPGGYHSPVAPRIPYVLSLYGGAVGLGLGLAAVRRRPGWAALAGLGLAGALAGGAGGDLLGRISGGLARYPEKLLFLPALALPLLAGWGLETVLETPRRWSRWALGVGGGSALAAAVLGFGAAGPARSWLAARLPPGSPPGTAASQVAGWTFALALLALLALGGAWAARGRHGEVLVALQLAALLQLHPLVLTDRTDAYREPPDWARRLEPGTAVVSATAASPFRDPGPRYRLAQPTVAARTRLAARDLDPAPGILNGLTYPLAPDLEGMHSPAMGLLLVRLSSLDWAGRVAWLRTLGVEALVLAENPDAAGLAPLERVTRSGVPTYLLGVPDPAPAVRWPRALATAPSPGAAMAAVATRPDPGVAVLQSPLPHDPRGRARLLAAGPDHLEIEVESGGGVLVLTRAYQPLLVARAGDRRLPTFPADLALLGIQVPPGRHRISVTASAWPETAAAALAALALLAALWTGIRRPGSWPTATLTQEPRPTTGGGG